MHCSTHMEEKLRCEGFGDGDCDSTSGFILFEEDGESSVIVCV